MLRSIFRPNREEVRGNWRKLCNEEHGMGRAWGTYGVEKKCTQGFSGEIGGKNIPLEVLVVVGRIILK